MYIILIGLFMYTYIHLYIVCTGAAWGRRERRAPPLRTSELPAGQETPKD